MPELGTGSKALVLVLDCHVSKYSDTYARPPRPSIVYRFVVDSHFRAGTRFE